MNQKNGAHIASTWRQRYRIIVLVQEKVSNLLLSFQCNKSAFRAALVANNFLGALRPQGNLAVCLLRAMMVLLADSFQQSTI